MEAIEQFFHVVLIIMLFKVVLWNSRVWPFKWKLLSSTIVLFKQCSKFTWVQILLTEAVEERIQPNYLFPHVQDPTNDNSHWYRKLVLDTDVESVPV